MSLPLSVPPGEVPPAGITFDAPVAEVPGAPAAVAAEAVDLAATVNVPPPAFGQTATSGDLAAEAARVRPATPPRPLGLTGLVTGTAGGGGDAEGSAPVLPVGLTGPGGGRVPPPPVPPAGGFAAPALGRPRTADVFSQMAGPIGVVEAFGGRPGRAEPPVIPEVDRSAPPAAVAPVGPASATAPGVRQPPPAAAAARRPPADPPAAPPADQGAGPDRGLRGRPGPVGRRGLHVDVQDGHRGRHPALRRPGRAAVRGGQAAVPRGAGLHPVRGRRAGPGPGHPGRGRQADRPDRGRGQPGHGPAGREDAVRLGAQRPQGRLPGPRRRRRPGPGGGPAVDPPRQGRGPDHGPGHGRRRPGRRHAA